MNGKTIRKEKANKNEDVRGLVGSHLLVGTGRPMVLASLPLNPALLRSVAGIKVK